MSIYLVMWEVAKVEFEERVVLGLVKEVDIEWFVNVGSTFVNV
jgi:hypothetical protein